MKRRTPPASEDAIIKPLPAASVMLAKLPTIREFLTATQYDDKTPREPGYVTLRNLGTTFEVTLYDPDAGLRLPCRGDTLDGVLALMEQLAGTEEAAWEVDRYLTQRKQERAKKRRK